MYIESDFVNTATLDLQANRKMHNRLLRHWPTKRVNGVEVMDLLYLYISGSGVQESASHKKIYNILGIKVEDLKKEKWKGIENYYLYFNVVQGTYDDITNEQLDTYLEFQAPFTVESTPAVPPAVPVYDRSEWFESELSYEPLKVDSLSNALSDSSIIAKVIANPYIVEYSIEDEHVLTALALLDVDEVIFEREFEVTYRGLTTVTFTSQTSKENAASFVKEANIEFRFRRKPETTQAEYDAYLNSIRTAIYGSVNAPHGSVYTQLLEVYHGIVPFVDSEILATKTTNVYDPETGEITSTEKLVGYKKAGLQAMKSKEFNKTITARIKTGYKKKKVKKWKKFVTIVLEVMIYTAYVLSGFNPVVLTIGSLVMYALAYVMAKHDPAWAAYINKSATRIGTVATIAGILNITQNLVDKFAAKAAEEGVKKSTAEILEDILVDFMKEAWNNSTSFTMENMLNAATKSWQVYAKYINPPADGLDDMARQIEEQNKQLEDLSSAELKDKIDYAFSSPFYNIYDFNEVMQAMPHRMTQGTIDDTFNKYYDGITSKVTYRGYLG